MFPVRDMNNISVEKGTMVGPMGFYLLEKPMNISRSGKFEFWRGSTILKVFSGAMVAFQGGSSGQVLMDGSSVYEFIGCDWGEAKSELELFFDSWLNKWFRKEAQDEREDQGSEGFS